MKPLEKNFWDETAEMLHVEGMLSKSLLKMQAAAQSEPLKELLTSYRAAVDENLARLSETLRLFELPVREKKSDAAMGLLLKGQQSIQRTGSGPVLDTLLLALCRKAIALKTASYTSLAGWAKLLSDGQHDPVKTYEALLQGEIQADVRFKRLVPKCDAAAAGQEVESARKAPPKKKELAEAPHWGGW